MLERFLLGEVNNLGELTHPYEPGSDEFNLWSNFNLFHHGFNTTLSDEEYDKLESRLKISREDLELETGETHLVTFTKVPKSTINNFGEIKESELRYGTVTPKYDGCGLAIYYRRGMLHKILTRSNPVQGKDQTEKLKSLVPQKVSKEISCIMVEAIVDLDFEFENSRNKANGLVNSKYLQDQVDSFLTLVAFQALNHKGEMLPFNVLKELPTIERIDSEYTVSPPKFTVTGTIDSTLITTLLNEYKNDEFNCLIDGVVIYFPDGSHSIFKLYYTESEVTTVKEISWSVSDQGIYVPCHVIEPVTINGKQVSRVSCNGVTKLQELCSGKDSKIEVILSGSTIPKVNSVIIPSENYQTPKCDSCNTELILDDEEYVFGPGVICPNYDCDLKWYDIADKIVDEHWDTKEYTIQDFLYSITIPRFSDEKYDEDKWNSLTSFSQDEFWSNYVDDETEDMGMFIKDLSDTLLLTPLQHRYLSFHSKAFYRCFKYYEDQGLRLVTLM